MTIFPDSILAYGKTYLHKTDRPPLWKVLHDAEMGEDRRKNLPEVQPLFPNHHVPFMQIWQRLSRAANPFLTDDKWTAVYGWKLWIANNQGFGNDDDPRANYILGTNLDKKDPRVEVLTCGGNLLTGYEETGNLVVETLDWRAFAPTTEWLLAHPWFCTYAVSVDGKGQPRRFPQGEQPNGEMKDIIHPLMADPERFTKITIPLDKVIRWTAAELPDKYRLYL